jgi:hypothetical protein
MRVFLEIEMADKVAIPNNADEAALMVMTGTAWLKQYAPERLTGAEYKTDAELLAWVLEHPETAAECLHDAAAGDGTARGNLEFRREAIAGRIGAA